VQDNSNLTLTHKPEPNPGGVLLIRFAAKQVASYGNVVNAFLTNRGESAISGAGSKLDPQTIAGSGVCLRMWRDFDRAGVYAA
jgi:hypothetical protein